MKHLLALLLISNFMLGKNPVYKPFVKTTYIAYSLGSTGYFGDIAPFENYLTTALKSARVSAGLEVSQSFKRNLTRKFNLNYVMLSSSNKYYDSCSSFASNFYKGKSFTSELIELSTSYEYGMYNHKFNPYFFGGFGIMAFKIRGDGNIHSAFCAPFGLGVKTAISKKMALALELNYRYTNSDLLDGLSDTDTKKIPNTSIQEGPDLFYTLNFKLIYKIKILDCPKIL
jgi:hypothetical protein